MDEFDCYNKACVRMLRWLSEDCMFLGIIHPTWGYMGS